MSAYRWRGFVIIARSAGTSGFTTENLLELLRFRYTGRSAMWFGDFGSNLPLREVVHQAVLHHFLLVLR